MNNNRPAGYYWVYTTSDEGKEWQVAYWAVYPAETDTMGYHHEADAYWLFAGTDDGSWFTVIKVGERLIHD